MGEQEGMETGKKSGGAVGKWQVWGGEGTNMVKEK